MASTQTGVILRRFDGRSLASDRNDFIRSGKGLAALSPLILALPCSGRTWTLTTLREKNGTKAVWLAAHLGNVGSTDRDRGLSGAAAAKLGISPGNVFVAKHRVQKMLQEEVRPLWNDPE